MRSLLISAALGLAAAGLLTLGVAIGAHGLCLPIAVPACSAVVDE